MAKPQESFTFTVGKLDAGMAILIGERAHLIEFPSILLPPGVGSGSIVNIAVHRNVAEEKRQKTEFWDLQEEIFQTFGVESPKFPQLELRNVTQTSVTLEWPPLELATAKIRSLDIHKNGQRFASVPAPLRDTSTRLSGLEVDKDYTFQLILKTTAGSYPSNVLRVRTHTISDTSGICVCFGNVQDPSLLEDAKAALKEMRAKWSDKIQIDTTHFVCTTPASGTASSPTIANAPGVEYQRALQLSIPVVQPHWVLACHAEKKMMPIANYYLGKTPVIPENSTFAQRRQSLPSSTSTKPPAGYRASMPASSLSKSSSPTSPKHSSSSFINESDITNEDTTQPSPTSPNGRERNGTMKKDFKFPNTASSVVPSAAPIAEQKSETPPPTLVSSQEVPPPPPVEKENPVPQDDQEDDDVGPTVEVDLN